MKRTRSSFPSARHLSILCTTAFGGSQNRLRDDVVPREEFRPDGVQQLASRTGIDSVGNP